MRAIGASNGAVRQIFIVESVLIGGLSWLTGGSISASGERLLSDQVGIAFIQTPLSYVFSLFGAGIWLVIVIVIAALASVLRLAPPPASRFATSLPTSRQADKVQPGRCGRRRRDWLTSFPRMYLDRVLSFALSILFPGKARLVRSLGARSQMTGLVSVITNGVRGRPVVQVIVPQCNGYQVSSASATLWWWLVGCVVGQSQRQVKTGPSSFGLLSARFFNECSTVTLGSLSATRLVTLP